MAGELNNILEQWTERRQLARPRRDADGKHFFVFDGQFEVALSQSAGSIFVETELTELPKCGDEAEDELVRILKLQLAKARSGREVLSLATDRDRWVLFRILPADGLTLRDFDTAVGDFVNAAAFWMVKLTPGDQTAVSPGPLPAQILRP